MKKAISLILALVLCLSLCACGGGNEIKESLVVGKWYSPNKSTLGHDVDYTIYFYADGSAKETWRNKQNDSIHENTFKWSVSGDTVVLKHLLLGTEYTYVIENGVEKLMASQAEGYWYEHIVD